MPRAARPWRSFHRAFYLIPVTTHHSLLLLFSLTNPSHLRRRSTTRPPPLRRFLSLNHLTHCRRELHFSLLYESFFFRIPLVVFTSVRRLKKRRLPHSLPRVAVALIHPFINSFHRPNDTPSGSVIPRTTTTALSGHTENRSLRRTATSDCERLITACTTSIDLPAGWSVQYSRSHAAPETKSLERDPLRHSL